MGWFDDNHWAGEAYDFGMGYMARGGHGYPSGAPRHWRQLAGMLHSARTAPHRDPFTDHYVKGTRKCSQCRAFKTTKDFNREEAAKPANRRVCNTCGPPLPRDVNALKVDALKKELESRGLSTSGTKAALVDRLETVLAQAAPAKKPAAPKKAASSASASSAFTSSASASSEAPFALPQIHGSTESYRVAPMPTPEQLEFGNAAGDALVGRQVLYNWEGVGWCTGVIESRNKSAAKRVGGQPVNFLVYYDVDDELAEHNLELAAYSQHGPHGAWVLLEVGQAEGGAPLERAAAPKRKAAAVEVVEAVAVDLASAAAKRPKPAKAAVVEVVEVVKASPGTVKRSADANADGAGVVAHPGLNPNRHFERDCSEEARDTAVSLIPKPPPSGVVRGLNGCGMPPPPAPERREPPQQPPPAVLKQCSACRKDLRAPSFSNTQWFKGAGKRRCKACVHANPNPTVHAHHWPVGEGLHSQHKPQSGTSYADGPKQELELLRSDAVTSIDDLIGKDPSTGKDCPQPGGQGGAAAEENPCRGWILIGDRDAALRAAPASRALLHDGARYGDVRPGATRAPDVYGPGRAHKHPRDNGYTYDRVTGDRIKDVKERR